MVADLRAAQAPEEGFQPFPPYRIAPRGAGPRRRCPTRGAQRGSRAPTRREKMQPFVWLSAHGSERNGSRPGAERVAIGRAGAGSGLRSEAIMRMWRGKRQARRSALRGTASTETPPPSLSSLCFTLDCNSRQSTILHEDNFTIEYWLMAICMWASSRVRGIPAKEDIKNFQPTSAVLIFMMETL